MYQNCCKKCGSISLHTEVKGNNTGLYCDDCGAWIKWLGKDELRAFEHSMREAIKEENEAVDKYLESISEPTGYNIYEDSTIIERLNRFIDGIDEAIDSVYDNPTAEHDKLIYNNAYAFALEKCKTGIQNIIEDREFNDLGESR